MYEEFGTTQICRDIVPKGESAGFACLGSLTEGQIVLSRPQSILVFTDGAKAIKSAKFKSRKLG